MSKKDKDRPAVDPAAANFLSGSEKQSEKDAEEDLTYRQKIARRRAKIQARYDLPEGMKDEIKAHAAELGTTASQLAAFLLADGLRRLEAGELDPASARTPSQTVLVEYNLEIEYEPHVS